MKTYVVDIRRDGVYTNVIVVLIGSWRFESSLSIVHKKNVNGNKTCAGFSLH